MELKIKATREFENFILKYNSQITLLKSEEINESSEYNSRLTDMAGQIGISLFVSVISPFITEAIRDYVESTHEEIVVKTENEQYVINQSNVKEIFPVLHSDIEATISEESNGKNRKF